MGDCSTCAEHAAMAPTVLAAEEHVFVTHLSGESVFLSYQHWWTRVDEWPGAPRGGEAEIAALLERLRRA